MRVNSIILNKTGYEPFIDFLKGVAILFVLLNHCLSNLTGIGFPFWGGQAVPLFLIIQSWHVFKKEGTIRIGINYFAKIFHRIILPFAVVEVIMLSSEVILGLKWGCLYEKVKVFIRSGGQGPGAYYFWMYLQFALLLPLFKKISKYITGWKFGVLLMGISIIVEILCNLFDCPFYLYRLAAFRYLFLIWFGYDWAKRGIKVGYIEGVLSIISIVFIWLFGYKHLTLTPYFFDYWQQYHWLCYFYPAYLLVWILNWIYVHIGTIVKMLFLNIGSNSYWIYISQLLVFYVWWLKFSQVDSLLRCIVTLALSVITGFGISYIIKKRIN